MSGTEDDQVSNEVAELVESFKKNIEVESEIVRKLLCEFFSFNNAYMKLL